MAFAGDGKGAQQNDHSGCLVNISSNMTELAENLVRLSASLEIMQAQLTQDQGLTGRENVKANLEIVRTNIMIMTQKLNKLPKQSSTDLVFEDFEEYLYGE